jgi:hypothetical protein
MCVDCVLASSRITQVDPSDEPLPKVVLSHSYESQILTQPYIDQKYVVMQVYRFFWPYLDIITIIMW